MDCNNCKEKTCFNCNNSEKIFKGNNPLTEIYTVPPVMIKGDEINEQYLKILEDMLEVPIPMRRG